MFETLTLQQHPELKKLIQTAFPDYRKKTCFLTDFHNGTGRQINTYWDGGSREVFVLIDMATMTRKPLPTGTHPFYEVVAKGLTDTQDQAVSIDHVGNITLKYLPLNWALVKGGTFCGKSATAMVMLLPENMTKFIAA